MNTTFELDDLTVAIAGDWHGNTAWIHKMIPAISRTDPGVRTILHLGDLWPNASVLRTIDIQCRATGIERVLVTLGNHEPWPVLTERLDASPGGAVQLSEHVFVLQRPQRFTIFGRQFLSLSGASSVDAEWRIPGKEWWPDERITDEQVAAAIAGGLCDIMLTHESVAGTPVELVQRILNGNPLGFPETALAKSAASREQVSRVWNATRPDLLVHGHMHAAGEGITDDGRRVVSLGCDGQAQNAVILDLTDLSLEVVPLSG